MFHHLPRNGLFALATVFLMTVPSLADEAAKVTVAEQISVRTSSQTDRPSRDFSFRARNFIFSMRRRCTYLGCDGVHALGVGY